jgi:hypothetical protein
MRSKEESSSCRSANDSNRAFAQRACKPSRGRRCRPGSAVHDDGNLRAVLRGEEAGGTIFAVNADTKITVKTVSDAPGGGIFTVNVANGQPAASLPDAGFAKKLKEEG